MMGNHSFFNMHTNIHVSYFRVSYTFRSARKVAVTVGSANVSNTAATAG